jgi:hypothetical protein
MVDQAPGRAGVPSRSGAIQEALERRSRAASGAVKYPKDVERVTRWEIIPPDRITFHDTVYRKGRVEIVGEERYRFLGGDQPGCIVEVMVLRKPISLVARIGFAVAPTWSVRSTHLEVAVLGEIDKAFCDRDSTRSR